MHIKGKNSWLKHLDFIGLNFLAFVISFVVAYGLRELNDKYRVYVYDCDQITYRIDNMYIDL